MWVSPRRSVVASVAAGCCLAASVIAGGYAASGALPFSEWPRGILSSDGAAQVSLAPATRAAAPVLTLPAPDADRERESESETTRVIPLDDAETTDTTQTRTSTPRRRTATTRPRTESRTTKGDDKPDTSPTTAPTPTATETPAATAASPAAEAGPAQAQAPVTTPATRKVKLADVSSSFASASDSESGQPELHVQMAVADSSEATPSTKTVALSLKLAPTDIQALRHSAATMGATRLALETQVDVVDATVVAAAGQPACADGQCLRVQMKFAQDTRTNPADQPEVSLLEDGDAISNRVMVVVKIDPADLGSLPAHDPTQPDPTPESGASSVLSLPLPPATDPSTPAEPTTDTATVSLPDADPTPGTPEAPAVQVDAQLEIVQTPTEPAAAPTAGAGGDAAAPEADDCP
jgi:hypothetical protein